MEDNEKTWLEQLRRGEEKAYRKFFEEYYQILCVFAGKYLKERNSERFYDETLKALWGYIGDKLLLPVSELSRDNVAANAFWEKAGYPARADINCRNRALR